MATRSYSRGVYAALMSLSRGTCYWPDCGTTIVRLVDSEPAVQVQIAHIRAVRPDGPRYDRAMTDRERNAFDNLMLLCVAHHNRVDRDHSHYPVERLQQWKRDAERLFGDAIVSLNDVDWTDVTSLKLEEAIAAALDDHLKRLGDAVTRLERIAPDAAALLRPLLDGLAAAQMTHVHVNEDVATMLHTASLRLQNLEDSATLLGNAADRLEQLPNWIDQLAAAANRMPNYEM